MSRVTPGGIGSISVTGSDGAIVDGVSSSLKATVLDLTDSNPLTTAIVDGNGDQITSFGGGTQYTEGDTDASITGTAMMWEDGSDTLRSVSAAKPLPISVATIPSHAVTNAGTFATQPAGSIAHDGDATSVNPVLVGGYASAAAPTSVSADGDSVRAWNLRNGARATVLTAAGALIGGDAANGLDVDVTRLSSLVAGAAEIGFVKIASGSIASGAIASGAVASGAFVAGSMADGANVTLGAKADAKSTATDTTAITIMQVLKQISASVQAPPSQAVTNAGTFVVQENGTQVQVDDAAFTPATSKILMAGFEADESSTDSVDEGDGGAARMTLDRKQIATLYPHTAGGLATAMFSGSDGSSILVATSQVIKASAGQVYGYYLYNPEATVTFVHFYNTAAASVTVGTTNPLFTVAVPAGSAANLALPYGILFSNAGFSIAATTTAGGNTAPATGVSAVIWYT